MKTHKVIDTFYFEEEGNDVYAGTEKECANFIAEQRSIGYRTVPMTKEEVELYKKLNKE
jgi:hypothetical protein